MSAILRSDFDNRGNKMLEKVIEAIEGGKSLSGFLAEGLNPNELYRGRPLIYWAVKQNCRDLYWQEAKSAKKANIIKNVKMLCDAGADIHWCDESGNTLLHVAEEYEVVKLLLAQGLDITLTNSKGIPIHNNDKYDGSGRVLAFFEAGLDLSYLNIKDNPALNHPTIMRSLLARQSLMPEEVDDALERALEIEEWLPSAKILIEAGATLLKKDSKGYTPLHTCINNIQIYGQHHEMWEYEKTNFRELDAKIFQDSYFQFAEYLYQSGTFANMVRADENCMWIPPLLVVQKDRDYYVSRRVIDLLAHYEAQVLNTIVRVDVEKYKRIIKKIIAETSSLRPNYDVVKASGELELLGFQPEFNFDRIGEIWGEELSITPPIFHTTSIMYLRK